MVQLFLDLSNLVINFRLGPIILTSSSVPSELRLRNTELGLLVWCFLVIAEQQYFCPTIKLNPHERTVFNGDFEKRCWHIVEKDFYYYNTSMNYYYSAE
jgi:hypothetical protein